MINSEKHDKSNNRNKILIIAALLLLVAITSVFIGTLSKYVASETDSDEAVVAKFGLNIPNTINLFSDSYTNVEADTDGKKIIAPGTEGSYKFTVSGTSEVAYIVSADIDIEYSEEWDSYTPLEFSVNGSTWTNIDTFKTNLTEALSSEEMAPNTTYSSDQTIHWRWPFDVSETNDTKDTAMGNLASTATAPSVIVNVEVTATQVD